MTETKLTTAYQRKLVVEKARQQHIQREIEAKVLQSLETLIDFPYNLQSSGGDAANPSLAHVAYLEQHLDLFQPSDLDALINERRAANRCGYVLCCRPPRKFEGVSTFKFVGRGDQFNIVPRKALETWCSDACAKRAMYIKAQLIEQSPALRDPNDHIKLSVLRDNPFPVAVESTPTVECNDPSTLAQPLDALQISDSVDNPVIDTTDSSASISDPPPASQISTNSPIIEAFETLSLTADSPAQLTSPERSKSHSILSDVVQREARGPPKPPVIVPSGRFVNAFLSSNLSFPSASHSSTSPGRSSP